MTHAGGFARRSDHAEAVLGPPESPDRPPAARSFAGTAPMPPASAELKNAIADAQQGIQRRLERRPGGRRGRQHPGADGGAAAAQAALKSAATTHVERATIEIVALLFQSILTEERIPAAVRVWFARLQMPVLRVAVSEPDFFATVDHPARA